MGPFNAGEAWNLIYILTDILQAEPGTHCHFLALMMD